VSRSLHNNLQIIKNHNHNHHNRCPQEGCGQQEGEEAAQGEEAEEG